MPVKQWDDVSLIKSYILHPHGSNSIRLDQDENDGPDTICGLGQTHERGIRRWLKILESGIASPNFWYTGLKIRPKQSLRPFWDNAESIKPAQWYILWSRLSI